MFCIIGLLSQRVEDCLYVFSLCCFSSVLKVFGINAVLDMFCFLLDVFVSGIVVGVIGVFIQAFFVIEVLIFIFVVFHDA